MSDFNRNPAARGFGADRAVAIDAGLRAYMIRVYNYMAGGVAITGVLAWLTFNMAVVQNAGGTITGLTPLGQTLFTSPIMWIVMLAPLAMVFFLSFRIQHMQAARRARCSSFTPPWSASRWRPCSWSTRRRR